MLGSATTAPTSTARFLYPELLWLEALRRGAVDGVFIARPDDDNLKGDVAELAVDKPEPLRPLTRDVELDSGEPGQVAADVSVAQLFADDMSVCEVVGDRHRGRDHLQSIGGQGREVSGGVRVRDDGAARWLAWSSHAGSRDAASAAPRKASPRSPPVNRRPSSWARR